MPKDQPLPNAANDVILSGPGSQAALVAQVAAIADGDHSALEELYCATRQLVFSLARRILGDADDAEEAALDVYQYVWQRARNYDAGRGPVRRWLAIITRGRSIDRMRSRDARRLKEEQVPDFLPPAEAFGDTAADPSEAALMSERDDALERALRSLNENERGVIDRAFFRGQTHQEIADALGEPLGTIKSQIRRGLMKLHDLMTTLDSDR